jgi:hypothetical protein
MLWSLEFSAALLGRGNEGLEERRARQSPILFISNIQLVPGPYAVPSEVGIAVVLPLRTGGFQNIQVKDPPRV